MLETVRKTIEKFHMLTSENQVLAALSGGADSVCLVLVLIKLGYKVNAIHINHQLRGAESERDEQFCRDFCHKIGVNLYVRRVDVREYMNSSGLSLETAARELRYREFADVAAKLGENVKIATAHNANDALETALFNLARGTGLRGLCGIPPVRGNFIRPFCEVTRKQIENFLLLNNQDFVTDSTNLIADCSRNVIRLEVIPKLELINSGLVANFMRSRENFTEDDEYLTEIAAEKFNFCKANGGYFVGDILNLHNAVKNRVLGDILKENNVEISVEKINELENTCRKNGKVNLKKDVFAVCKDGMLKFETSADTAAITPKICLEITLNRQTAFLDRSVCLQIVEGRAFDEVKINKKLTNLLIDYDKINGAIMLRNRREGDKIALANRGFTSKVKKLLQQSVPQNERDSRIILENNGKVIYLEGFGVAECVKLDENSQRALRVVIN